MIARRLLHVAVEREFDARESASSYAPEAMREEGFIHCCRAEQLVGVLERYYRDRDDLVLLTLDEAALEGALKEEDTTGRGELFPHLYGEIPRSAIVAVDPFATDAAGVRRAR
ncbi:MAG: DUF952 domain-containing protein [Pseudomonadales bacterium]|nr:DUF952 domain-containing protein [Pseudomonadales bacterium]